MKQAVMTEPKKIEFREVSDPVAGKGEILINIKSIGVCGSDIHVYKGEHPYVSYPLVQGHEVSGEVVAVGGDVGGFKPGEKVTIEPQVSCGKCYPCTHGMPNICKNLKVIGFQTTGTASDYFAIPARKAVKLPKDMSFEEGAMIEPTSVGVGAARKLGNVEGRKALVFGAGPVGNLTAQVFKGLGAETVMIADINDLRLEKARECGIEHTANTKNPDFRDRVTEIFGEEGPGLIIDCAGVNATMDMAIEIVRQGGYILVIGVFPGKVSLDINLAQEKDLHFLCTARYVIEDFRTAIDLVNSGKVNLQPLITHTFAFEDYIEAYRQIENHGDKTMKVMVTVNE